VSAAISLTDLVDHGEYNDHQHLPLGHNPTDPLEWLGLAVGDLPYLTSSARTIDDINWASLAPHAARVHLQLIDSFGQQLAGSGALIHRALLRHIERHPELGNLEEILTDVDFLSHALIEDHPPLSRRADLLQGGYVTALAAAVQGSGENGSPAVVGESLTRALATLLGHARLNARDRVVVAERAAG
jgi:hypothetical protein